MPRQGHPEVRIEGGQLILSNELFFTEVLSRVAEGYQVEIHAKGRSMLPFIRSQRDVITLAALTPESLQVGRIVLIRITRGYVLHRIEEIYPGGRIVLRGDGNPYQREACIPSQVLAEAIIIKRGKQRIPQGSWRWWCYEHLWPSAPLLRRTLLYFYRRTLFRLGY